MAPPKSPTHNIQKSCAQSGIKLTCRVYTPSAIEAEEDVEKTLAYKGVEEPKNKIEELKRGYDGYTADPQDSDWGTRQQHTDLR